MSDHDEKQATAPKKPVKPLGMSDGDRETFVDLQMQQAAEAAHKAAGQQGDQRGPAARHALAIAKAALATHAPGGHPTDTMLRTVNAMYLRFWSLHAVVRDDAAIATEIATLLHAMRDRFASFSWQPPGLLDAQPRAGSIDAEASLVSPEETVALGNLHMRAAREHVMSAWDRIAAGEMTVMPLAASTLATAQRMLTNPAIAHVLEPAIEEVVATEVLLLSLTTILDEKPRQLRELHAFAMTLDRLAVLVGRPAVWGAKLGARATAKESKDSAAPPVHEGKRQTWKQSVWLRDTNYQNEEVGCIVLEIDAIKSPTGQIYAKAKATPALSDRAQQVIRLQATSEPMSRSEDGEQYALLAITVELAGPNKSFSETNEVGAEVGTDNAKLTAGNSKTVQTQKHGTTSFARAFKIAPLGRPMPQLQMIDGYIPKLIDAEMSLTELVEERRDFQHFVIDEGDIEDTWVEEQLLGSWFTADWHLESYSI